jgi:hypothetical protein
VGLDPKVSLDIWPILTRQSASGAATQIDRSQRRPVAKADERVVAPPLRADGNVPIRPAVTPPDQTKAAAELDLIKNVKAAGTREPPTGLGRVHQRLTTLCPGSICGFVERPATEIERCLKNPKDSTCRALQPLCDPRSDSGPASCGTLPADFSESGVLAIWAEGVEVKEAVNVRILPQDDGQWQPLKIGIKLQAGDLVFLPLTGSLRLQLDNVAFGDVRIDEAEISGVRGHMLAISGPSTANLLAKPPKRGALSFDQLNKGVQAGAFEPRAMTREDWDRANGYAVLPQHRPTPTLKEIMEINANFDALHRGLERERAR